VSATLTPAPRSALLSCWTRAWLSGEASLPEVVARVTGHDDLHLVADLWIDDLELDQAVGRLRADGIDRLRVVLPAPGDPLGLPGPGQFTKEAMLAGEGVLALKADGTGYGLVPSITSHGSDLDGTVTSVRWSAYPVEISGPDQGPFLHEAEHDLRRGLVEATQALVDLDVARWNPDIGNALDDLRQARRRAPEEDDLPDGWSARARQVLTQAGYISRILTLVGNDIGGAVDSHEAEARSKVLRDLARVVRRARVAAFNAPSEGAR